MGTTMRELGNAGLCGIPSITMKRNLRIHPLRVLAAAWHSDGVHLASLDQSGALVMWDTASKFVCQYLARPFGTSLAIAPTKSIEHTTVAVGGVDNCISLCDMSSTLKQGEVIKMIPPDGPAHDGLVSSLAFIDENTLISAGGDGILKIWNTTTCVVKQTLKGHMRDVTSMAVHGSNIKGAISVSGSVDGTLRVWDLHSAECTHLFECKSEVTAVAFFPDGRLVAAGFPDGEVRLFDLRSDNQVAQFKSDAILGACTGVQFSSSGRAIYSSHEDGNIAIWDPFGEGGHEHKVSVLKNQPLSGLAISPTNGALAVPCWDEMVKIFTPKTK